MNVIKDLLRIKRYREEKAELALVRARYALLLADQSLAESRVAVSTYQSEFSSKEQQLYRDLCVRLVLLKDINAVTLEVELMKDELNRLTDAVLSAKEARALAADVLEQARLAHREAVRMREKFMEIKRIQDAEVASEIARLEDLEMEEAASNRHAQKNDSSRFNDYLSEDAL